MLSAFQRLFASDGPSRHSPEVDHRAATRLPTWLKRRRRDERIPSESGGEPLDHAELTAVIDRLRAELAQAEFRQNPTVLTPSVSTAEAAARAEITSDYVRFVEQTLNHGCRTVLRLTGQPATGERIATTMGTLSCGLLSRQAAGSLLTQVIPQPMNAKNRIELLDLLTVLQQEAAELLSRIPTQTRSHEWLFFARSGLRLDPDRQQPWRRSDPHLLVTGIVAPGLTLDGRIFCKQWVTTG